MCGISFSKIDFTSKNIDFKKKIKKINYLLYLKEYKALLNEIRSLKSNQTFFQIVIKKNKSFIIELNKVLEKIKILKSLTKTEFDLFNDIQWVIESEIFFKSKRIRNFLEKNKISFSQKSVIFVRYFLYTIFNSFTRHTTSFY